MVFPASITYGQLDPSGKTLSVGLSSPLVSVTVNTVERLRATGAGGTLAATFGGQTATIGRAASAASVQALLQALSSVGAGNALVTGPPGNWSVQFTGTLGGVAQPLFTTSSASLTTAFPTDPTTPGTTARVDKDATVGILTGAWLSVPFGFGGGHYEIQAQGSGDNYATWTFPSLAAGWYEVCASWTPGNTPPSLYAAAAAYRVLDGATNKGLFTASQTQTPDTSGRATLADVASGIQALAKVYCGSGTLTVTLADDATGLLNADLVSVLPCDPAASVLGDCNVPIQTATTWGGVGGGFTGPARQSALLAGQTQELSAGYVLPGTHTLEATWIAAAGNSAQATYAVYDGAATTPAATFTVDQTASPSGGTTRTGSNVRPFAVLGTVTILSGRCRVVLSSTDSATKTLSADTIALTMISLAVRSETASASAAFVSTAQPPRLTHNGTVLPLTQAMAYYHAASGVGDGLSLPHLQYFLPSSLAGQTLTLDADDNTFVTDAGPASGCTALAVADHSGGTILPALSAKTMRIGYNLHTPYSIATVMYSDLMRGSGDWIWLNIAEGSYTATGFPVAYQTSTIFCEVRSSPTNVADPKGYPNGPFGLYTAFWKGDGTGTLDLLANSGVLYTIASNTVAGAWNKTVFNIVPDNTVTPLPYFAGFGMVIRTGPTGIPVSELHVYDPTILDAVTGKLVSDVSVLDPANVAKLHPQFIAQLAGAKCLRSVFCLGSNSSDIREFADYPTEAQRSFGALDNRKKTFQIVSIDQYANAPNFLLTSHDHMLVTLDRPHGLTSGQTVSFWAPSTGPTPNVIHVLTASGGYAGLENDSTIIWYDAATMTTSQIAVGTPDSMPGGNFAVTTPYTNGGHIEVGTDSMPPADYFELLALLPDCDAWVNIPPTGSDDLITQVFTLCKNMLPAGRKIYAELSNEYWNANLGYSQFFYYAGLGQQVGKGGAYGYVKLAGHMFTVAAAALGTRSGDLIPVYGSLAAVSDITVQIITEIDSQGFQATAKAFGVAPYSEVYPHDEVTLDAAAAGADVGQCLDVLERYVSLERPRTLQVAPHRAVLDANFPNAVLVDYEGSIGSAGLATNATVKAKQSQAAFFHPRYYGINQYYFNTLQKGGVTLHCQLSHSYPFIAEGANPSVLYGTFQGWNQPSGPNDGTGPNAYDSRPDVAGVPPGPSDKSLAESVVGYAIKRWNAGIGAVVVASSASRRRKQTTGRGYSRCLQSVYRR
jgi:hypothetical protein